MSRFIDRSLLNTLTKAEVMQYIEDLERIIEGAKKDENLQNLAKVFQNSVDKLKIELDTRRMKTN